MALLLRKEIFRAEVPGGVHLLTPDGAVTLTGSSVHRLLDRLAPALDGTRTLEDLTARLRPEQADAVRRLAGLLVDSGVVREVDPAAVDDQPDNDIARFPVELAELGYRDDTPVRTFTGYRARAADVTGTGALADAVAAALADTGLRRVLRTADPAADRHLSVTVAADGPAVRWHVLVSAQDVWIWADRHDTTDGGRRSVEHRLRGLRGDTDRGTALPDLAVTVVACRVAHAVYRTSTGLDLPAADQVTRFDPVDLASDRHRHLQHPFTTTAPEPDGQRLLATVAALRAGATLDDELFSARAARLADDRLGPFGTPHEHDFVQTPLHVCQIAVADPVALLGNGAPPPVVTGAGVDFATARYRGARHALACYASLMVDPRRLHGDQVRDLPPWQALAALRQRRISAAALGYGLGDGRAHPVEAAAVFPALATTSAPYTTPVGTATGYHWADAVEKGLLDHVRRITLRALSTRDTTCPLVEPVDDLCTAAASTSLALLRSGRQTVELHDITGALRLPTYLCHVDGVAAGCAAALTAPVALEQTLEQALLHQQATAHGQLTYLPAPIGPLPARLRGAADNAYRPPPPCSLVEAVSQVDRQCGRTLAVPLDHDPAVTEAVPYILRVVIDHDR